MKYGQPLHGKPEQEQVFGEKKSCTKTVTNPNMTTVSANFMRKDCSEVIQVE